MEIGDKKKAAILSIVLLMILSVGAFEFIPRGGKPDVVAKLMATGAVAAQHQKDIDEALPTTITSAPFSKPQTVAATSSVDVKTTSTMDHAPNKSPGAGAMPPLIPGDLNLMPGSKQLVGTGLPNPSENTVKSQIQIKENIRTATLEAVLNVERWTAVVTVSGQDEPMHCKVGDSIGGHLILGIDDSGITLLRGKHTVAVSVGSTVNL